MVHSSVNIRATYMLNGRISAGSPSRCTMTTLTQERLHSEAREKTILDFLTCSTLYMAYHQAPAYMQDSYDYYPEGENRDKAGKRIVEYVTKERAN